MNFNRDVPNPNSNPNSNPNLNFPEPELPRTRTRTWVFEPNPNSNPNLMQNQRKREHTHLWVLLCFLKTIQVVIFVKLFKKNACKMDPNDRNSPMWNIKKNFVKKSGKNCTPVSTECFWTFFNISNTFLDLK